MYGITRCLKGEPMNQNRYLTRLEDIPQISKEEIKHLKPVIDRYAFRISEYYLSLIDWDNPSDPIRRIIIPDFSELSSWGKLDASHEEDYTVAPGLQHKYSDTALILVNDVCGGYCRFCFRKRLFMSENDEVVRDTSEGLRYIQLHPEIRNVILSGGDPLILSTGRLEGIIAGISLIDHIDTIRIGTKMLAFNPHRVLDDPSLPEMLSNYSDINCRIYIMNHFNHPRELTREVLEANDMLLHAGLITANQTPLVRGVNDNPAVLSDLFKRLSNAGIPPYYLFQGRPTAGNLTYSVPVEDGLRIFQKALENCSGLAKRARFTMSHHTGKIEILGMSENSIFMKYHRSPDREMIGKIIVLQRNPEAYWLNDYEEFTTGIEESITAEEIILN